MSGGKKYLIPGSTQYVTVTQEVLDLFEKYRQKNNLPERGGLLFARFQLPEIVICRASIPSKLDVKLKFSFIPNKGHQRRVINSLFRKKLHFVGEWHTHPQMLPSASQLDLNSMKDSFIKSEHELNFFILAIVGLADDDESIWLSLHNAEKYIKLVAVNS